MGTSMGTKIVRSNKGLGRTKAEPLTDLAVRSLKAGQKRIDGRETGKAGRLMIRARAVGRGQRREIVREFFFRYRNGCVDRLIRLGTYPELSLREANRKADQQSELIRNGVDPQAQRERQHAEQRRREREERETLEREARRGTLADLFRHYVEHLRNAGKVSATQVERSLALHVSGPFPSLADRAANEITSDDISDVLALMISKGIARRTNLVRAYMRAAFAYGAKLDNDPRRKAAAIKAGDSTEFRKLFAIRENPVAIVARIAEYDRARDRVLNDDELRDYCKGLVDLHPAIGGLLKGALLLGGQRLSQLKRVTWADFDAKARTLRLRDTKGRGGVRDHALPVSNQVAAILSRMRALNPQGLIFSTRGGEIEIDLSTLSNAVRDIAGKSAQLRSERAYSLGDLRRTVETRLAALGISKEIRAQVLSHGRSSGVQERHYDRHDYLPEKATALAKWERHVSSVLKGEKTKVVKGRFRRRD